jgi:hypothetical protein
MVQLTLKIVNIIFAMALYIANLSSVVAFPRHPKHLPGKGLRVISTRLSAKSFEDFKCIGTYDKFAFALAERICDDCFEVYQELDIIPMCRFVIEIQIRLFISKCCLC